VRALLLGFGNVGRGVADILVRRDQYPGLAALDVDVVGIVTGAHGALVNRRGLDLARVLADWSRQGGFAPSHPDHADLGALEAIPLLRLAHRGDVDDFADPPRASRHHRDAIGEEHGFIDLMGDEQDGLASLAPDLEQLGLHVLPGLCVQRRERLVHQQDHRIGRKRAREIDALLHAA